MNITFYAHACFRLEGDGLAVITDPYTPGPEGSRFDPDRLVVRAASAGQTGVYEASGRLLYSVASKDEAEALVTMLKHYRFDHQCQMGLSGRNGLKFLAKVGR